MCFGHVEGTQALLESGRLYQHVVRGDGCKSSFFDVSAVPFWKSCYKFASVGNEGSNRSSTLILSPYKTPHQMHWPVSPPLQTNSAVVKNSTISWLFVSSCARVLLITVPLSLRGIVFHSSYLPVDGHLLHICSRVTRWSITVTAKDKNQLSSSLQLDFEFHLHRQTFSSFCAVFFFFLKLWQGWTIVTLLHLLQFSATQMQTNRHQDDVVSTKTLDFISTL